MCPILGANVKVKKQSYPLCFNWTPRHEGILWEWMYSSTHSFTSVLDGGEWSASRPGRFTPRERAPGTHWIGGWVGPRDILDAVVKRKIPSSCREWNPGTPIVQPVAQCYTDWAITALPILAISTTNATWNSGSRIRIDVSSNASVTPQLYFICGLHNRSLCGLHNFTCFLTDLRRPVPCVMWWLRSLQLHFRICVCVCRTMCPYLSQCIIHLWISNSNTHGRHEEYIQNFGLNTWREETILKT
jgi:hypothetical protein